MFIWGVATHSHCHGIVKNHQKLHYAFKKDLQCREFIIIKQHILYFTWNINKTFKKQERKEVQVYAKKLINKFEKSPIWYFGEMFLHPK